MNSKGNSEAMHINWEKANLNQQVNHVNLAITYALGIVIIYAFSLCY